MAPFSTSGIALTTDVITVNRGPINVNSTSEINGLKVGPADIEDSLFYERRFAGNDDSRYAFISPSSCATSGDLSLLTLTRPNPFFYSLLQYDAVDSKNSKVLDLYPINYPEPMHAAPLGDGRFAMGFYTRFNCEKTLMITWQKPTGGYAQRRVSLLLPPPPAPSAWILPSLKTSTEGMVFLAGGPTLGGKESIGIGSLHDGSARYQAAGITWQLTNKTGSFGAKRLFPTIGNRVFAIGVNEAGVIGMQLFQQPSFYQGISVQFPKMNRGERGYYKVSLARPAPTGGYNVATSYLRSRFSGIPETIAVPEGSRFVEGEFRVVSTCPLGEATITTRVDARHDTVNAVHTATTTVTNEYLDRP